MRVILAISLLCAALLFSSFIRHEQGPKAQNILQFEADTLFFKPAIAGKKIQLSFKYTVNSIKPIRINQVYTGCSCTATDYNEDSMYNGDKGELKLVFDSKEWGNDTGYLVNKHVYVIYNGGSQVIYFQGRVFSYGERDNGGGKQD